MAPAPRPAMASASKAEKEAEVVMGVRMIDIRVGASECTDKMADE